MSWAGSETPAVHSTESPSGRFRLRRPAYAAGSKIAPQFFLKITEKCNAFFSGSRVFDPCRGPAAKRRPCTARNPHRGDFACGDQLTQLDRGRTESPARRYFFIKSRKNNGRPCLSDAGVSHLPRSPRVLKCLFFTAIRTGPVSDAVSVC